jgi:hypothetical protein
MNYYLPFFALDDSEVLDICATLGFVTNVSSLELGGEDVFCGCLRLVEFFVLISLAGVL